MYLCSVVITTDVHSNSIKVHSPYLDREADTSAQYLLNNVF